MRRSIPRTRFGIPVAIHDSGRAERFPSYVIHAPGPRRPPAPPGHGRVGGRVELGAVDHVTQDPCDGKPLYSDSRSFRCGHSALVQTQYSSCLWYWT